MEDQHKLDNPSEKENVVIIPEVLKGSLEDRAQRLDSYKETFFKQQKALAVLQEDILQTISNNPEASLEILKDKLSATQESYQLNEEQVAVGYEILSEYTKKHEAILAIRKQYPDDRLLAKALFAEGNGNASFPAGEISVDQGPMTLHFKCRDLEDAITIYLYPRTIDQLRKESTPEHYKWIMDIFHSGAGFTKGGDSGCFLNSSIEGTITCEIVTTESIPKFSDIFVHEEQHAFNKLIFKHTHAQIDIPEFDNVLESRNLVVLKKFLREYISFPERKTQDEILANYKSGLSPDDVFQVIQFSRSDGRAYDFIRNSKSIIESMIVASFPDELVDPAMHLIDTAYRDYDQNFLQGIFAIHELEQAGYSREQIISFLQKEKLPNWRKFTGRLIQLGSNLHNHQSQE